MNSSPATELRTSPPGTFVPLVRLFVSRVFHGSGDSNDNELNLSAGLVLAFLALPGAFYCLLLLEKYSTLLQWMRGQPGIDPLAGALPDEYFFIVLSMVVTGVLAVWRWDSIFPDRRDYANLVPLPIPTRNIFAANLSAILFLALVLAIDVNAASAILFPLVVSASENTFGFFLHFVGVHATVVILASVFSFCAVFAIIGVLMVTLPYGTFRRLSFYLRALILGGLVALLSTSFAVPPMLKQPSHSWARLLPSVWFLALCQLMRGKANASFVRLGQLSLIAVGATVVAGITLYGISYRRCFMRIPEIADVTQPAARERGVWFFRVADRLFLQGPLQRAGYRFAMKTLLRSELHGLVLGGFLGLGIVFSCQCLFDSLGNNHGDWRGIPPAQILAIPLALSYCILAGLRFALELPTSLRANWTFRLHVDRSTEECAPLAQKIMLTFVLPWVAGIVFPVYTWFWGWKAGIVHATVIALCSSLFAQLLLRNYRKIPFACAYRAFGQASVVLALLYGIGFFVYVLGIARLESWALPSVIASGVLILVLSVTCFLFPRLGRAEEDIREAVRFDEDTADAFELLGLKDGS